MALSDLPPKPPLVVPSEPIAQVENRLPTANWYSWFFRVSNVVEAIQGTRDILQQLVINGISPDDDGEMTLTPDDVGAETIGLHQGTVEITANTTITAEHIGKVLRCTSAVTLTIDTKSSEDVPNRGWVIIENRSSGLVTLSTEIGVTLTTFDDLRDISQKGSFGLWKDDADNEWSGEGRLE